MSVFECIEEHMMHHGRQYAGYILKSSKRASRISCFYIGSQFKQFLQFQLISYPACIDCRFVWELETNKFCKKHFRYNVINLTQRISFYINNNGIVSEKENEYFVLPFSRDWYAALCPLMWHTIVSHDATPSFSLRKMGKNKTFGLFGKRCNC